MKRFNFIFTGRYLKFWYIAFAIVVGLMLYNYKRLQAVDSYTVIFYDSGGNKTQEFEVSRAELIAAGGFKALPTTKVFIPHKPLNPFKRS